jgi:hypothetical protein
VSIDHEAQQIYWSEDGAGPRIRRANLDGSGVEDVVTASTLIGFSNPFGVAVDSVGRALFFVSGGPSGFIQRSELDGTQVVTVLAGLDDPSGLSLTWP